MFKRQTMKFKTNDNFEQRRFNPTLASRISIVIFLFFCLRKPKEISTFYDTKNYSVYYVVSITRRHYYNVDSIIAVTIAVIFLYVAFLFRIFFLAVYLHIMFSNQPSHECNLFRLATACFTGLCFSSFRFIR